MNISLTIIAFIYACTGIISTIGYLPTIKDLINKKNSANIHSYIIWTLCSGVTFLYSIAVISDLLLEIVTGLNFISCLTILILSLNLKRKNSIKL